MILKQKIIDTATELAQKYGLNAFSYQDISMIVGIKKSSIHHHFPSKTDLSYAILESYTTKFFAYLKEYEQKGCSSLELLIEYINIFKQVAIDKNKICLCFMYASDYLTLDKSIQDIIKQFYLDNEAWLTGILTKYLPTYLSKDEQINQYSRLLFSTLQGLLVRNRILNSIHEFDTIIQVLTSRLQLKP